MCLLHSLSLSAMVMMVRSPIKRVSRVYIYINQRPETCLAFSFGAMEVIVVVVAMVVVAIMCIVL